MRRALTVALSLLAACQTLPAPDDATDGNGVPACIRNDQGYRELARELTPGQPVLAATGDRWFKITFTAPGTVALKVQDIPEYGAFSYAVYDAGSTRAVAAENFTDERDGQIPGVTDTGSISAPGVVLVNIKHTKIELTCDQYRLTLRRR